ncbi:MAG TPA: hypothetical protein VFV42_06095 [Acidimicrobiales bacterium]|nr:hypothetical protein [Acidimicrobiales bacterium]
MPRSLPSAPLWSLRACWLLLPVVAGPAVADALDDRSRPVQLVGSGLAWGAWAVLLVAALVPRTVTLTVVRTVAPGAVALAAWSAIGPERAPWAAAGVVGAVVCTLLAFTPAVADAFVDGSSYGDERRVALRTPLAVAAGPAAIAWVLAAAGAVTGPLLLAAEHWVAGAVATAVGLPLAALAGRRLHVLSRRWLVFVPAGVVVHDPIALAEPVLLRRHVLRRVGPAEADAVERGAVDLTGGALGLALELRAAEPFPLARRQGRGTVEAAGADAVLVTPGRPAATLEIAAERKLPVT